MRNINVDRDPMSSEDVSSYKDFKSILKKHAETTNDLNKITTSKSISWLAISGGVFVLVAFLGGLFFINNNKVAVNSAPLVVEEEIAKLADEKVILKKNEWQLMINSSEDPIHEHFDFDLLSSNRIEYIKLGDYESIKTLLKSMKNIDLEFTRDKKVFKLSVDSKLKISADKYLFKFVEGSWFKVDHQPFEFDELVKPKKMEQGKPGIAIDAVGFGKKFQEFENMIWQPVQPEDIDSSFFGHNWSDGSITKTNAPGVYNITLKEGDINKQFYGYPVLQKYAYKRALKKYNKKLLKQQELMKKALKSFDIPKGVYTIAKSK